MKNTILIISIILTLAGGAVFAQTTAFTYQGSLKDGANPASGNYDFQFVLFDASGALISGILPKNNVAVANGIFSVSLDFGNLFPGANRFLEIRVRQAGNGAFTTLAPRQQVTSNPYSIKSLDAVNATQLGGLPSSGFIQNSTSLQALSNFNISGTGTANHIRSMGNADFLGNVGIGTTAPQQKLHVDGSEILSTGTAAGFKFRDRGSLSASDDWVWYSDSNIARFFRAGVGDLFSIQTNGNVGVGTVNPVEKLSVNGKIQSTSGGFKFPDGTVQTAAANTTYTKRRASTEPPIGIIGGGGNGGLSSIMLMSVPAGTYLISITAEFRNNVNFVGQNNTRRIGCQLSNGDTYSLDVPGLSRSTTTFQWLSTVSSITDNVSVFCYHSGDFQNDVVQAAATRLTAVKVEGNVIVQ